MSRRDLLLPLKAAGLLLAAAGLLHLVAPAAWHWVLLAAIVATAGALLVGERVGLRKEWERRAAAGAVGSGGAWLALATWQGAHRWPARILYPLLLLAGIPWWRRRRAGRSKAHGITPEQLKQARGVERWLLEPQQEWTEQGWRSYTRWERISRQANLAESTILRVEAVPAGLLFRVEVPGGTLAEARAALPKLEASDLDARPGSMDVAQDPDRARVFLFKLRTTAPDPEPLPWPGPPRDASIYDPVQLGAYLDGGPLEHPLFGQHVLISGASGSGKSVTLNVEVAHVAACSDAIMVGCDLKGGAELGPWEPLFLRLATTREEAEVLLEWVVERLEERGPILKRRGLRTWQCTSEEPAIVVFVDEHARLSYSKRAVAAIEQVMEQGRALGIIYVGCLQKATKDALGSNRIGPNITVRIAHRVANVTEVGVALGPGAKSDGWDADEIPKSMKGALYLDGPDAETPRLARAFYATKARVDAAVVELRRVVTARPGLAMIPPAGPVPNQPTNQDEPGEGGGGEDDVLPILRAVGEPMLFSEIVARSTASRATVNRRLNAYRDALRPLVEQLGDGRWKALGPSGESQSHDTPRPRVGGS